MKDYSTGEAQWLLDPEAAKEENNGDTHHYPLQDDLEQECVPCRICGTILLIGIMLGATIGGVLYHSTIVRWTKDPTTRWSAHLPWHEHNTTSSISSATSLPAKSRQEIANAALEALNANFAYYHHNTKTAALLPPPPASTQQQHAHCQATVLLLRHCDDLGRYATDDNSNDDKDDDDTTAAATDNRTTNTTIVDQHCSHMGYERAAFLPSLFERIWSNPDYLYAQLPPVSHKKKWKGINYRQIETLLPLSQLFHIPIHIVQQPSEIGPHLISQLFQGDDTTLQCDSLTVVAWKHKYIPDVAAALGCGPEQGCSATEYPDDTFDDVWELRFVYNPEEPNTVVADLFHQNSPLLQDDHGYLQEQLNMRNAAAAPDDDGDDVTATLPSLPPPKVWTVYGTVTHQNFDPLEAEVATKRSRPVEDNDSPPPPPRSLSSRFHEL